MQLDCISNGALAAGWLTPAISITRDRPRWAQTFVRTERARHHTNAHTGSPRSVTCLTARMVSRNDRKRPQTIARDDEFDANAHLAPCAERAASRGTRAV